MTRRIVLMVVLLLLLVGWVSRDPAPEWTPEQQAELDAAVQHCAEVEDASCEG